MICPHCLVMFHDSERCALLGRDIDGYWGVISKTCPNCLKLILMLVNGDLDRRHGIDRLTNRTYEALIWPKTSSRSPIPAQVPEEFAEDYREACLVIIDSPKASAALSRRCLQHILREKGGVKRGNLADEIQQMLNSNNLPLDIAKSIDAIRNIGNFAAHPSKSNNTGEVVSVESGEAEWCLEVIEMLYEFYFVRPAVNQEKIDAMNLKLADAGKSPMKS